MTNTGALLDHIAAVSAATVQRYIDTQYERPWRQGRPE